MDTDKVQARPQKGIASAGRSDHPSWKKPLIAKPRDPCPYGHLQEPPTCTCNRCQPWLYSIDHHPRDTEIATQGLNFQQHDTWHLASIAVATFGKKDFMTRWGQMRALSDWRNWWQSARSAQAKAFQTMHLREVNSNIFVKLSEVLSQIFFIGTLPTRILRVDWAAGDEIRSYGLTYATSHDGGRTVIQINPDMRYHKLNARAVICTLLHEMIHTYLGRYGCFGGQGSACGSEICQRLYRDNHSASGYGRAWQ